MATSREGVLTQIGKRPISFSIAFLAFFLLSFGFLAAVGSTPEPLAETPANTELSGTAVQTNDMPEEAVRIVAKDIGLDTAIVTPASTDEAVMEEALTHGAMRWPTSAPLGVNGTVALFGHSSYLPVVYHQYYKTFDGIQDLKPGALVSVYSNAHEYRYRVTGVKVVDSTIDRVDLPSDAKYLTLVTCNSFAAKEKRFVVTATFEGAYDLQS